MNNLTVIKNDGMPAYASGKLTRSECGTAMSSFASIENPRISSMGGPQIAKIISAIGLKVAVRLGRKPIEEEEQDLIDMEINRDLIKKFPTLTEREVMEALENGLDGEYQRRPEDPIIFTPSNFVQWIKAYIAQTKTPVQKKLARLAQDQKDDEWIIPESERLKVSHEFFLSVVKRVLAGEDYEDWGNSVYTFLDNIGFMVVQKEDKWKAFEFAKRQMMKDALESPDVAVRKSEVRRVSQLVSQSDLGYQGNEIIDRARRLLVTQRLADLIEMYEEDQTAYLELVAERVEYLCIDLKSPEQYNQQS
ncbi:hypothetical protein LZD49_26270 [Dyadobacter sp. CY261]|uniref:hypothetical protein n=1 Tax=Dyadobacter sp. CY261 TaxID=2907203 RepID=UPI001F2864B4|nr:hypothetical protein [Dyadobacter sp. CY261]MCF0074015.1 hypothetical protein [Dyadobacter sp. CY261]